MKAENRERLRVVQGTLGALVGAYNDNIGLMGAIKGAAELVIDVLESEPTKESEEQQCKE